ncbi:MAG: XRE family transcriptional regulator, partial [Chloroflexia bacterium]|nr:XRE family transcriptional regulator [Chloroflexia bacterium]
MATKAHAVFGDLLRHARRNAGLTQEALAERAGLSTRAVSDLERGINRTPRRDTLEMLAEALGLPPAERAQWERARKQLAVRTTAGTVPDTAPSQLNLPTPVTTFIGRQQDIRAAAKLLCRSDGRMLTLTGPGGVGKTRLSLMVAREVATHFPDGVWFVNLAPLNDPGLVLPTVAKTLNIP